METLPANLRVALIHDWLLGMRGGERCLEVFCSLYPDAEIFTLFYAPQQITPVINRHRVHESALGKLPAAKRIHRYLLPLFPAGAKSLSGKIAREHAKRPFDLVISISHCAAKNVRAPEGVPHICYCLTPVRYLWDKFDDYFRGRRLEPVVRRLMPKLRAWDVEGSRYIDRFVAISNFVRERIERCYGVSADVVYPPVAADWICPAAADEKQNRFLCVSALVPYKNVDVIIDAFKALELPLTIIGRGPEEKRLRQRAAGNIEFVSQVTDQQLAAYYRSARALVFAAEEDFGLVCVEAQAAGRPVIAFGRGGSLETINPGVTGLFFSELTSESIQECVHAFLDRENSFKVEDSVARAKEFSVQRFISELSGVIERVLDSQRKTAGRAPERAVKESF